MKFSGKNVLVTGASKGIGADIARILGSYNLKVWINYRNNQDSALRVKEYIENNGGSASIIAFDVTKENEIIDAFKAIVDCDGGLDYLVNNAGITNDKLALRMKSEDFMNVIQSNLLSTFIGCREALKIMSKNKFGSIVNISSIVGERGNTGQTNYAASKGGIIAMSKSFAYEGAPRNIRFNVITPGFVDTEMTSSLKDEIKDMYIKNIPLGRLASGVEIANAVAFLLSDSASYITGEVLRVNGGLYM
ncbi:3-oxoacyl-[acyl-carrier-protein] reductase [Helicobacter sp. 16-1353]|uniref:3-oxoacyl-ACP reductase FabG n=1 Tax=Helicobacter sp. 16-1353 TaxID=2004996 RepID=UPI000DCD4041|nr:3-oxoacyl-ACP reductase FabG [Helicobacter sp. 16-1353]RAX52701.1 3-oxoacyl-[acyl-carrier-protein] reductase [Helicobacter sp. 16-1353]